MLFTHIWIIWNRSQVHIFNTGGVIDRQSWKSSFALKSVQNASLGRPKKRIVDKREKNWWNEKPRIYTWCVWQNTSFKVGMSEIGGIKISRVGIWEKDDLDLFLFVWMTTQGMNSRKSRILTLKWKMWYSRHQKCCKQCITIIYDRMQSFRTIGWREHK